MSKTITKNQYHALVGLMVLAERYNRAIVEIELAAREITGDEEHGHTSDEVYGGDGTPNADNLLRKLMITIED